MALGFSSCVCFEKQGKETTDHPAALAFLSNNSKQNCIFFFQGTGWARASVFSGVHLHLSLGGQLLLTADAFSGGGEQAGSGWQNLQTHMAVLTLPFSPRPSGEVPVASETWKGHHGTGHGTQRGRS